MVYDNISKGMPLICSGQSTDINHAYVCDGYQSDGNLFHFNWGWGGAGDGYFLLTGNDPNRDEKDSYTTYEAIFNLKPADTPYVEGTEGEFPLIVYKAGYMATYDDETEANKRTDVITRDKEEKVEGLDFSLIYSGYVASDFSLIYSGYVAHQYDIGFKFKNESNEYIIPFMFQRRLLQPFTNVSYNIWPSTYENILKNGKYTLSYVYKDITACNTEWKDAIYQPGVTKPEIEVDGEEPCCCVIEKPELLYNGKAVVGFNINRVPNVNELTLKMKVKVLAPQKDNKITVTLSGYKPDFFCEAKSLNLTNIAADAVQTVEAKFSIKDIPSDYWLSIDFYQEYKEGCMYVPYSKTYPMQFYIYDDNPTGIETIPLAEEKASTETIYDIYGRKVSTMNRAGLYIKNGKKFLVK